MFESSLLAHCGLHTALRFPFVLAREDGVALEPSEWRDEERIAHEECFHLIGWR